MAPGRLDRCRFLRPDAIEWAVPSTRYVQVADLVTDHLGHSAASTRAWVDESGSDHLADPHTYILSAVILPADTEEQARQVMQALRLKGQEKLHWRNERQPRQTQIAAAIARLPSAHLVVIHQRLHERTERARRACLERLLWELTGDQVPEVILESRGKADDRRDLQMLDHLRRRHGLQGPIHMNHRRGREEPMLWIPDAVCGCIVADRTGTHQHLAPIHASTRVVHITDT